MKRRSFIASVLATIGLSRTASSTEIRSSVRNDRTLHWSDCPDYIDVPGDFSLQPLEGDWPKVEWTSLDGFKVTTPTPTEESEGAE